MRDVLIVLSILLTSCGPVNKKENVKQQDYSGSINKNIYISKKEIFYVYKELQYVKEPELGDNTYLFRVINASDLTTLTEHAKIKVMYWMPTMPAMPGGEDFAILNEDGTYQVNIEFSMNGRWEINVTIEDGDKRDLSVFDINM